MSAKAVEDERIGGIRRPRLVGARIVGVVFAAGCGLSSLALAYFLFRRWQDADLGSMAASAHEPSFYLVTAAIAGAVGLLLLAVIGRIWKRSPN